jgi:hypothetical protein
MYIKEGEWSAQCPRYSVDGSMGGSKRRYPCPGPGRCTIKEFFIDSESKHRGFKCG